MHPDDGHFRNSLRQRPHAGPDKMEHTSTAAYFTHGSDLGGGRAHSPIKDNKKRKQTGTLNSYLEVAHAQALPGSWTKAKRD